jgi:pyruvate dehydrogenase E2 component (dihydrolipoamide acetyltransferase)
MEDRILAIKNIVTPDFGGGAADLTVIELLVKPGDQIAVDTPIVTLESDKATMEVPTTEAGIVKEVKVKIGDKITTGSLLITIEAAGAGSTAGAGKAEKETVVKPAEKSPKKEMKKETVSKKEGKKQITEESDEDSDEDSESEEKSSRASSKRAASQTQAHAEESATVLTGTIQTTSDVHAGPGVRQLARELGVNLAVVPGSGPKQRIVKEDVQLFVKTQLSQLQNTSSSMSLPAAPAIDFSKFGPTTIHALSRIQKISGKNLQRNWMMIPHVTQFAEVDISILEEFRQSQKAELDKQKIKLTPLVFIMKAVVATLKVFPQVNASLDPSGENLILKNYYNIGVAVDTPNGLVVPVVRDVDKKGLLDLAKELAQVSERARNKQLTPADMQGGCFSISSLGGIGGTAFTPIINAPEVAILGVSKASYKPVYQDGAFVPRLMLPLSLSYDHRVIDGADGARFIVHLSNMLSDIRNLLL